MNEMRVKVGVKVRDTYKKRETKKLTENRCPESGGEMEARKTEIAMGDCIKSDYERVGEEWKK